MRFSALRTLATLLRVVAILEGAVGLYLAIKAASGADGSTLVFLAASASVAFKVLITLAVAEGIGVFLAIEENTRPSTQPAVAKRPEKEADDDELDEPPAQPAKSRFVTCASCGKQTEADSRFCQKCGKLVAKDE
jgi:hypothetical protein